MVSAAKRAIIHIALLSCVACIAITGCGENNTAGNRAMNLNMNTSDAQQPMASVKMTVPTHTQLGKSQLLSVMVTEQGKPLNQVEDVMFEIWKDVQGSKHEIIHAKRTGDGVYSVKYMFSATGTYNVLYHVVAGGNMIMTAPQKVEVSK